MNPLQKGAHVGQHAVEVVLQQPVPAILEQAQLGVREVAQVGARSGLRHVAVPWPPHDQGRRAMFAQVGLKARKPIEVGLEPLHEPHRHLASNRRVHERPVQVPEIRRHRFSDRGPIGAGLRDRSDRERLEKEVHFLAREFDAEDAGKVAQFSL
jgi:hypothetical protein